MEDVSLAAFWLALAATALSVAGYWSELLGVRLVIRRLATDAGEGPVVATFDQTEATSLSEPTGQLARAATWAAAAMFVLWAAARWQAVGHAPWSNMYEFTVAFGGAMTLFCVAFERLYRPDEDRRPAAVLGALILPVVLALLVIAAAFFPSEIHPLVPALQNSDLLAIHVATMILAYGALSLSFAAAVLYLAKAKTNRFARLPKARTLDDLAYRSVMVGFPLLALGIALGAYWANHAWGRYWGWDPKETSALVTWLIYGVYLHMRGLRNWRGSRSAWVLVGGFGAVMFTYFAVNLWVSGLHSYAGV